MTVTPLDRAVAGRLGPVPDTPADAASSAAGAAEGVDFARALDAAQAVLERADGAERAFAHGGGLQEMVLARAQADVMLSIATAAASRTAQSLSAILSMQV